MAADKERALDSIFNSVEESFTTILDIPQSGSIGGNNHVLKKKDRSVSLVPVPESTGGILIGHCEDKNSKRRRKMEDTHCYHYNWGNVPGQTFAAIFDGHAGKAVANYCQENFDKELLKNIQELFPSASIEECFEFTFSEIDRKLEEKKDEMNSGCTVVSLLITTTVEGNRVIYTANAGDARAVLWYNAAPLLLTHSVFSRGGKAIRLSCDHKGTDEAEIQRITEAGGFVMHGRVCGVLAVTRALGDIDMKEFVTGKPFVSKTAIVEDEDEFIILACDGLWDVCTDQEAVDISRDLMDKPYEAAEMLVDHALESFSTDNLSVIFIRLNKK